MMTVSGVFFQSSASVCVASIMSHTKMETIADPTTQIPWQDIWPTIRKIVHMTTAHPNVANCAQLKNVDWTCRHAFSMPNSMRNSLVRICSACWNGQRISRYDFDIITLEMPRGCLPWFSGDFWPWRSLNVSANYSICTIWANAGMACSEKVQEL